MAEHLAPQAVPTEQEQARAVVALCDRFLAQAGLPTYTTLADARIAEVESAAQRLTTDAHRAMAAELSRLRVAHAVVASECRSAIRALERNDTFAVDNLLTEAIGTASLHARPHQGAPVYGPNVIALAPARAARRAADFGGL